MTASERACVIWRFVDGRPGHENQTLGLVRALERRLAVDCLEINAKQSWQTIRSLIAGSKQWRAQPRPDLLIGCGHRTHLPLLAARNRFGGRAIVCMKPSIPVKWFDLCLVPEHDGIPECTSVLLTRGALNTVRPAEHLNPRSGLILIGGPSKSHGWDEGWLQRQITELLAANPEVKWTLTTSPRTPPATVELLASLAGKTICIIPFKETTKDWVAAQLSQCGQVRVTEDSVSMIYESLTSGAQVGLLEVPRLKSGRVTRGIDGLVQKGQVFRGARSPDGNVTRPVFCEADRCAAVVHQRFLMARAIK